MAIYNCNCTADSKGNTQGANYQDKVYGKGRRVHTGYGDTPALETQKKQRCTVCGKIR